jgi:hypothetical protein
MLMLNVIPDHEFQQKHFEMKDGLLAPVKPPKIYIDGAETKSASAIIDAGKMKVIGATFETDPVPFRRETHPRGQEEEPGLGTKYNTVVICPVIRFFDSKGQPVLAVCRGWQSSRPGKPIGGTNFGPAPGDRPARLLPVASTGSATRSA